MRDFVIRFAAGLGLLGFGIAGFVALMTGSGAVTALLRASMGGGVFIFVGWLVAVILYDGPAKPPVPPIPLRPVEKTKGE